MPVILPVQDWGVNWEHWPVSVTQDRHVSSKHLRDKNTPKACDSRKVTHTSSTLPAFVHLISLSPQSLTDVLAAGLFCPPHDGQDLFSVPLPRLFMFC